MGNSEISDVPYDERTDIEKIKSNWNKTKGLYRRKEWSSSIVRAATAVEISANLVIRQELETKRHLDADFVDNLLIWANGIQGKYDRLILPLLKNTENYNLFVSLRQDIFEVNKERNSIAHSGHFKIKSTAKKIIILSKNVIESMVMPYIDDFTLKDII